MGHLDSSFTSLEGISILGDAFVVIVKTEWNNDITDELTKGCKEVLDAAGIQHKTITVPGAVELVSGIKALLIGTHHTPVDAFIAFGCVIQGGTPHFEYVCNIVSQGITMLNVQYDKPIIFGVLTVNNKEQAIERIGGSEGHKGKEAAIAAIKMINISQIQLVK